jgi:uncharacterized protein involved in cysteine biosynthesis
VLFAIGQVRPLLIAFVLTLYVLVLVPILEAFIPLHVVKTQAFHSSQFPTQSTGQSVLLHVLSVSSVLSVIGQVRPLLLSGLVTLYVLVLVPILDLVLIPSQVAAQAFHSPQSPMQSTGQSIFWHVESVCGVLFAIGQV